MIEVFNHLIQLKQNGTRDLDGLDGRILKMSASIISDTLTYIYNLCIDKSYFPLKLKNAKVIPIHKGGEYSDPSNYRPISIISLLSKPIEKHIYHHLNKHLTKYNLIHENQSGFRKNHSCHTALTQLLDKCLLNINNNEFNGMVYADFAKAFDIISHSLLIKKLKHYGVNTHTLDFLTSFLQHRKQLVQIGPKQSKFLPLTNGVPQGSIMGPLLFSIYINDLPLSVTNSCEMFADDTSLHASDINPTNLCFKLQNSINDLIDWTELNHMALNAKKTKCMFLTTRQKRIKMTTLFPSLYAYNKQIKEVDSHKVLGVTIDKDLSWSEHIATLAKSLSQRVYQLSKIKHFLDVSSRKLFFHAHIQSRINYASTLWDRASETNLKYIFRLYKRAIKMVLLKPNSLNTNDYKKLDILPFKSSLIYNKYMFMHKIMNGFAPNKIISNFITNQNRHKHIITLPRPNNNLF